MVGGGKGRFNTHSFWKLRSGVNSSFILVRIVKKIFYYRITNKYHAQILLTTDIKGEPVFPHGLNGIFISANAVIGASCTIYHQVTIGSNDIKTSKSYGAPIIGDNVYIGTGAKIIGGVKIGNNVRIGANCIITDNVPDNATVVMNKPRVIIRERK